MTVLTLTGLPCIHAQPSGRPPHGRMPKDPTITVLDVDANGVISAEEIASASTALLKLDKNGNSKLTRDEIMPQRPGGPGGPGDPGPGPQGPANNERQ